MSDYVTAEEVNAMTASEYDTYFRTKVKEAMEDNSPSIPHEVVMAEIDERLKRPIFK